MLFTYETFECLNIYQGIQIFHKKINYENFSIFEIEQK